MNSPILLVEDEPGYQHLMQVALAEAHVQNELVVMDDGTEALDYLFCRGAYAHRSASDQPVLVLLDLNLPKLDGLEVLKAIRNDPRTARLGVVILTSSPLEDAVAHGYESNADVYLQKPIQFAALIKSVARAGAGWLISNDTPAI